jgi:hypothetical protein
MQASVPAILLNRLDYIGFQWNAWRFGKYFESIHRG